MKKDGRNREWRQRDIYPHAARHLSLNCSRLSKHAACLRQNYRDEKMERSVRVEGLDMEASTEDIRDFFARSRTAVGRVYILGGPRREALIEFASGNDARRALRYSGRFLKGSKVILHKSSISEVKRKLTYFWNKKKKRSLSEPLPHEEVLPQMSTDDCRTVSVRFPTISPLSVANEFIQTSDKPRDPRTASARSPTILSPPSHTEVFQTTDKPHDPRTASAYSPVILSPPDHAEVQTFDKPHAPKLYLHNNHNESLQTFDKPCDPRTRPVPSGCPPMCDKSHEPKILSPPVPSDFLQTADEIPTDKVYHPFAPSLSSLKCDNPLKYKDFSTPVEGSQNSGPSEMPDPLQNAFLLGVRTVLESLQTYQSEQWEVLPDLDRQEDSSAITPKPELSMPGYVRLFGLPLSTTKEDICSFFKGLNVGEVVNMKLEHRCVCLVKFARKQDADDALQFNSKYMGPICVEIRNATEKLWNLAIKESEKAQMEDCERNSLTDSGKRKRLVPEDNCNHSKKPRFISEREEYIVQVCNLPLTTTKTDLRRYLECHKLPRSRVQHLLDKESNRTDTAFLIFNQKADYEHAMTRDGLLVGSGHIKVSIISRDEMVKKRREIQWPRKSFKRRTHTGSEIPGKKLAPKTCLLVQNMSECMKDSLMKKLSHKYKVTAEDISILSDNGSCTAMVQFKSLKHVSMARKLSQELLGENAITKFITPTEMQNFAN
ncbi:RNA binding motif protein 12Ba [Syngnathoides biaculeatus]|uniref:RNA binding motif protein 12Ba n=1 Tax=Syngnathoides biaculeatus TaxID=300417 RepID=UPI002ADE024F|nr:RNA binding motif protein 12Ba [Syngnathoides biaculeatus]